MANCLYLECNSGISGDMLVAALLDLGADKEVLAAALNSLPVKGFTYEISTVKKAGVACCDFNVILDAEHENHDHDMAYLHGEQEHVHEHHHHHHDHEHTHEHHHHDEHGHEHHHHDHCEEHGHEHHYENSHAHPHEHHHHHEHRGLAEIITIINGANITDGAKEIALRIFDIIADAEAKAHAVAKNEVHFHEVGAVDSIVDIVAIAVCVDNLGITDVIVPKLCEGSGTIRCQHGILPVPVPAVANIMQSYGLKVEIMPLQGEFVTPTGAAAVAALQTSNELPKEMIIKKIGLGAGKRIYERPSILRAMLIEAEASKKKSDQGLTKDRIIKLETDIDDCSGEVLAYTMERLLAAGARDVHYKPVYMKKNRPAWELVVIAAPELVTELEKIIFRETTTIGIRHIAMERTVLPRKIMEVNTPYGKALVKACDIQGKTEYYPEYESLRELALANDVALQKLYQIVIGICRENTL